MGFSTRGRLMKHLNREKRKRVYKAFKTSKQFKMTLDHMKDLYSNPEPMSDTLIKTNIKPATMGLVKMDSVFKKTKVVTIKPKKKVSFKTKDGKEVSF